MFGNPLWSVFTHITQETSPTFCERAPGHGLKGRFSFSFALHFWNTLAGSGRCRLVSQQDNLQVPWETLDWDSCNHFPWKQRFGQKGKGIKRPMSFQGKFFWRPNFAFLFFLNRSSNSGVRVFDFRPFGDWLAWPFLVDWGETHLLKC